MSEGRRRAAPIRCGGGGGRGAGWRARGSRPAEEERGRGGVRAVRSGGTEVSLLITRRPLAANGRSGRVMQGAGGLFGVPCLLPAPPSFPTPDAWALWREWVLLAW